MSSIAELKDKLICAGQILTQEEQGDLIWGHITARVPRRPHLLLMKPATIGLEEMTPENIITVNLDGAKVAGRLPRHLEVFIHTEVMRSRPEINAVVHTHPPHAVAFSSLGRPLLPIGHEGSIFSDGLPVFSQTTDLIVDAERGAAVARALGRHNAMILRNHGIVTAGGSVEEALLIALALEKACKVQLMAEACGGARLVTPPAEAKIKRGRICRAELYRDVFDYLGRRVAGAGGGRGKSRRDRGGSNASHR
ncbi:MAG: class II aldolase/adducin family protein [Pseudomonadota bacterium]